ncbi:acyltransferase [Candidatus Pacearchaeota archaeon]|nr:acyltransferase [Candidatus Pacearchaeota archaeon]
MLSNIILKIKRQENTFYALLYKAGKSLYSFSFPSVKFIHLPLYYLDNISKSILKRIWQVFWCIPLFRARCEKSGKGLKLPNGIPLIIGDSLKIYLGKNVTIGRSTIGASKVFDQPVLRIGSNSSIGYGTAISVSKEIIIGHDTMISVNCLIMDSDDHPVSPAKRLLKEGVNKEEVKPVKIGSNVWIGAHTAILKGVTIGDNSIVGTHSVVTGDIPKNCIYAGAPARLIKKDIHNL